VLPTLLRHHHRSHPLSCSTTWSAQDVAAPRCCSRPSNHAAPDKVLRIRASRMELRRGVCHGIRACTWYVPADGVVPCPNSTSSPICRSQGAMAHVAQPDSAALDYLIKFLIQPQAHPSLPPTPPSQLPSASTALPSRTTPPDSTRLVVVGGSLPAAALQLTRCL
jgi:hypothetical protein